MNFTQITVVGTGLIGGSFALALRKHGYTGRIVGCDDESVLRRARIRGVVDDAVTEPADAVRGSDLVVLATPVGTIPGLMKRIAPALDATALVTDVGSTKAEIARHALAVFGERAAQRFLPGHPMAGKEACGLAEADGDLFRGAVWLLTPLPGQDPEQAPWSGFVRLVERLGAQVVAIDAERHDRLCAWISHLPQMLSTALAATVADVEAALRAEFGEDHPILSQLSGPALRDMTRLALSPYSVWRDIALTNTENLSDALARLEQSLAHLRASLRSPELQTQFDRAAGFANRLRERNSEATS
jgi:prephenate dehydrogenase